MPSHKPAYRLTVYAPRSVDPAELTVLTPIGGAAHSDPFQVTTLPSLAGWKPYLLPPTGRSGRIDALNKRTDVGVMAFRIIDPQLPTAATKLTRWVAAFAGDAKGRLRFGNLKAFAEESLDGGATWTAFWTGRIRQVQDNVVSVELRVRELADDLAALAFVGRPDASISYAGFPTILPVAASAIVFGTLPAVTPLTGTVNASIFSSSALVTLDATSRGRKDNLVTTAFVQSTVWTGQALLGPPPNARVHLKRLDTQAQGFFSLRLANQAVQFASRHNQVTSLTIQELDATEPGFLAFPPNGTSVEVWVEADHYATEDTPLLINDVHPVTLWKHLLEGKFGYRWMPPETLPPGKAYGDPRLAVPYDTAAFAALEADLSFGTVRFVVQKREKRGEWIEKNLLPAAHLAYYLDGAGRVVPVDLRLPSDVSSAPTITDADLLGLPAWDYDRGRAVTRVDAVYYRDLPITTVDDLDANPNRVPDFPTGGFKALRYPVTIIDIGNTDLGDQPFALDLVGFRFMEGEMLQGQPRAEYLQRQLVRLALEEARPFGFGSPELVLLCARGSAGDAQPGAIRKVTASAILDPQTNVRGGPRVIRVSGREEKGPGIEIRGDDLGLATAAAIPTLGAPAQEAGNTMNGVTTAVTLNAAGDAVQVQYAVTDPGVGTAPLDGSPLWTSIPATRIFGASGIVYATATVSIRPVPAGVRVWVRGRSFPLGGTGIVKLPSGWVAAGGTGRVDTAALAAPSAPASANILARSFRVTWTNGTPDYGTEILLATPTSDPRVVVARLPAGSIRYDFPGGTGVDILPSTTYRVGIRHFQDSPASVGAEVTIDVVTGAAAISIPPPSLRPFIGLKVFS